MEVDMALLPHDIPTNSLRKGKGKREKEKEKEKGNGFS